MKYGMPALTDGYRRFSINILDLNKKVAGLIIGSFALYLRELIINMEVGDEIILKGLGKFVKWKRKIKTDNLFTKDSIDGYVDCVRFVTSPTLKKEIRCTKKKKPPYV